MHLNNSMPNTLKTYTVPRTGQPILACRKCQKKLKRNPELRDLARLKKTVKEQNREHPEQRVHVIHVPCMDLCPKRGVTICDPAQIPNRLIIVRSKEDLEALRSRCAQPVQTGRSGQ